MERSNVKGAVAPLKKKEFFLLTLRRKRLNPVLRNSLQEVSWEPRQLIAPLFISESLKSPEELKGLAGHHVHTVDSASRTVERYLEKHLNQVLLFGVPAEKDFHAKQTLSPNGIVPETIRTLRERFGDAAFIWTDLCLCSFTDTGQCGFVHEKGFVENDSTVEHLAKTALVYAQAGANGIAPSDMMDGRVGAIRNILDQNQLSDVAIMSYAAKFASHFYGPFREAAQSAPKTTTVAPSTDPKRPSPRANYQIDPAAREDALQSARRDVAEGADIIMVKPGLPYLDILHQLANELPTPMAVYQVSGEYSSLMSLAENGYADQAAIFHETMIAFRRAGAQLIITYAAENLVDQCRN